MAIDKGIHDGHKKRLREKFAADSSFFGFSEHEILELLLNFVNVRQNTNDTAHKLIDRFGNLSAVLDAPVQELITVDGVGERMATFIAMQRCLFEEYQKRKYQVKNIRDKEELVHYLRMLFITARGKEKLYLICVSRGGKILREKFISVGNDSFVGIDPKVIIKEASMCGASGVILAHNHPTEICVPSIADISMTHKINQLLEISGILLIDHYVVTADECMSIRQDDRYIKYEQN